MTGWRFALSRRWAGYLVLVVVFAIACVVLSQWQLARRGEARAEIERVDANWSRVAEPIDRLLPTLDAFDPIDKWAPVMLEGRYLAAESLLVRGRPRDSKPGFDQLVPFELADGRIFIVDRGWVPAGSARDEPDSVPAPPGGTVNVVARLKPTEPVVAGRSAPAGQVATINLPVIAGLLDAPTYVGAYGLLDSEQPAADRPAAAVRPVPDEGPHLSYAFQWLVFGLLAFVGLFWAVRREYRAINADDPREQERAAERLRRSRLRPRSDSEVEDELIETTRRAR